jgi:hypothetical protein
MLPTMPYSWLSDVHTSNPQHCGGSWLVLLLLLLLHVSKLRWCIRWPNSRLSSTHFVKSGALRPSCSAR